MRSRKIEVVLVDGTSYGIKKAELFNWSGCLISGPRNSLKKLKDVEGADMSAVYFLIGEGNEVYVGETDNLGQRLAQHALKRLDWTHFVALTSGKLTKTSVRFLEYFFAKRLLSDGLAKLMNEALPSLPKIQKIDVDELESFVDEASTIMHALGYALLGANEKTENEAKSEGVSVLCKGPDADAKGVYGDGLLVLKGSLARSESAPNFQGSNYEKMRNLMVTSGILVLHTDKQFIFTQNHLFTSASAAANVVLARSANGLTEWKTESGKTIKDLE